jgi:hypothetical protein
MLSMKAFLRRKENHTCGKLKPALSNFLAYAKFNILKVIDNFKYFNI